MSKFFDIKLHFHRRHGVVDVLDYVHQDDLEEEYYRLRKIPKSQGHYVITPSRMEQAG